MSVLHYVEHWLELSAGFVHGQVSRSAVRPVVVSHNAVEHLDAFPIRPLVRLDRLARLVPPRRWPSTRTTALRAIAAAYRVGVVHVHFGYVVRDVLPFAKAAHLPLVLSLHGDDATALPRRQPGHYDPVIDAVSAVIVPSQFLADIATGIGFGRARIHVIQSGVDTTFFTPTPVPGEPVVVFVGRLVEKKGLDVLLAAWPRVRAAVPAARLHVLGAGPLAAMLPTDDPSVRHIAPDAAHRAAQVRDVIAGARVVVTPSHTSEQGDAESLLLVNLEAQASGRPVVTTQHGGIPEFVAAGESALVVPERDPDALAAALIDVLSDDDLAMRLGAAGPALARRFDIVDCAARVDRLYAVVQSRSIPQP